MNISSWLIEAAHQRPEAPALFQGTQLRASYATFAAQVASVAGHLRATGTVPGQRVAVFAENSTDYLIALLGIWHAGAIAVPINAKLHPAEAAWILDNSGASQVFVSERLAADLADTCTLPQTILGSDTWGAIISGPPAPLTGRAPGDTAWLFYTSGTTGRPKGVQITHGMLAAASLSYVVDVDPVSPADCSLYAAPMSHGAGLYSLIHIRQGARHVCPTSGGYDPDETLALADHHGSASMFLAPTMVRRLLDQAKAQGTVGPGLKTVVYGGGPMYLADIVEAVEWFGPRFVQIYGQGECPMTITALSRADVADRTHPRWRDRLASVGRAHSVVQVQVVDAAGAPLPPDQPGEIIVRGLPVMPGYWKNPDATAKTLRVGWLWTGDIGALDADGYLTLHDRSKDLIISGGSNIYPREVEEVLLTHPDVHEVSVIGRPSETWGEEVVACLVLRPGATLERAALDAHCTDRIARFKRPKAYVVLAELPKNAYGKVLKTELRQNLSSAG